MTASVYLVLNGDETLFQALRVYGVISSELQPWNLDPVFIPTSQRESRNWSVAEPGPEPRAVQLWSGHPSHGHAASLTP